MRAHLESPRYGSDRPAELLTIADVARLLGVSRGSVYSLMRSGELSPIRVGRRARFEPGDIRAFIERHREGKAQ
jgi:excisionase family DNA binding protein